MYVLTLVYCLVAHPSKCIEQPGYTEFQNSMACLVSAQRDAAQWINDHPEYQLSKIICEPPEHRQEKI